MSISDVIFFGEHKGAKDRFDLDLLSVFSRDFMFFYYHNLVDDTRALQIRDPEALLIDDEAMKAIVSWDIFLQRIAGFIHPEDRDQALRILSEDGYKAVLTHSSVQNIDVRWDYGEEGYLYSSIVISKPDDAEEDTSAAFVGIKKVDRATMERIAREKINRRYAAAIFALSQEYPEVVVIDIIENEMIPCFPTTGGTFFEDADGVIDYDEAIKAFVWSTVADDQQELMQLAMSREYVKWSLREKDTYVREYLNRDNQYCEMKFLNPEPEEDIKMLIMGFGIKDEEIRAKIEDARVRDMSQSLTDGLSKEYHTVWVIHPDRNMELYRTTGKSTLMDALRLGMDLKDYALCLPLYVRRYVAEADQERLLEQGTYYNLIKNVPENGVMPVTYKRVDKDGLETYHQCCFAKAKGIDGETNLVMAFRDVDETIRQQIREREQYNSVVRERDSDGLTAMNNRLCYERRIREYPEYLVESISCIYIDVDGLHELNNTKGHEAGDVMLKFVAKNVQEMWGFDDTYRIGGDEFVAFVFNKEEKDLLEEMVNFRKIISDEGYRVSMGESTRPLEDIDMPGCIKEAEERMYAEKRSHYSGANDRRRR